jgi:hypothetical protein
VGAAEHDWVRQNVLIEGLQDSVSLGEVHQGFLNYAGVGSSVQEVQKQTLVLVRELVSDGLADLGTPNRGRFDTWNLPLDDAMARIEDAYVTHFDDRWGWVTSAWLKLTDKGEKLALELYSADESGS